MERKKLGGGDVSSDKNHMLDSYNLPN